MLTTIVLATALSGLALATPQAPPPPVLLTASKSGVLPVVPTNFAGVETIEGAITYQGPVVPGFVGPGGPAVAQTNQPTTCYQAVLPSSNFDDLTGSTITGSIIGSGTSTGVSFNINFSGFPSEPEYGPFVYHIHGMAVPADGNCSETLGHLDPTNRGELYACDDTNPQTCQAGDLAGKHGNITAPTFMAMYTDPYLSTTPGSPYFFGDKSIVIHSMNTTRLTCANFMMVTCPGNSTMGGNSTMPGNGTQPSASPTPTPFMGAAAGMAVGYVAPLGALMAAVAAFAL